jgi:hypothetical protein
MIPFTLSLKEFRTQDMEGIYNRLVEAAKEHSSQSEFCTKAGIGSQVLWSFQYNAIKHKKDPNSATLANIQRLINYHKLDPRWIFKGIKPNETIYTHQPKVKEEPQQSTSDAVLSALDEKIALLEEQLASLKMAKSILYPDAVAS